jgi:hypothetical protein
MPDFRDLTRRIFGRRALRDLQEQYPGEAYSRQAEIDLSKKPWIDPKDVELLRAAPSGDLLYRTLTLDVISRRIADEALGFTSESERMVLRDYAIGLIDSKNPYAEMREVDGQRIIALHRGMMLVIADFSNLVVAGLRVAPRVPRKDAELLIMALARKAFQICLMFLSNHTLRGSPFLEGPYELDLESKLESSCLCHYVELYCVLHEYGHILHHSRGRQTTQGALDRRAEEIGADTWAAEVLLQNCRQAAFVRQFSELAIWVSISPAVFFVIAAFLEAFLNNADLISRKLPPVDLPAGIDLSQYPTAAERFKTVVSVMSRSHMRLEHDSVQAADQAWDLGQMLWGICELHLGNGYFLEILKPQ